MTDCCLLTSQYLLQLFANLLTIIFTLNFAQQIATSSSLQRRCKRYTRIHRMRQQMPHNSLESSISRTCRSAFEVRTANQSRTHPIKIEKGSGWQRVGENFRRLLILRTIRTRTSATSGFRKSWSVNGA
jgi:hypothetical protein